MSIIWNTGPAAMRARFNLKLNKNKKKRKKLQASSIKLQAPSAMKRTQLNDIARLERC